MQPYQNILKAMEKDFSPADYPCLHDQLKRFDREKPLSGKSVLYASPLTINTLVALMPMLAGGARLTISWPDIVPVYQPALALMRSLGIECMENVPVDREFDVILDCCGKHAGHHAVSGYVELTRTGVEVYEQHPDLVCIDIDSSLIKQFETTLGTGDGLVRALRQEGFGQLQGKQTLLFGYGKVGKGICQHLLEEGGLVTVVEPRDDLNVPDGVGRLASLDTESIIAQLHKCDFVVTATGVEAVIQNNYPLDEFIKSKAVLINMGAVDEYGPECPGSAVLNNKQCFNFILEEPTLMKFMDPIFTLFNESAVLLLNNHYEAGLYLPPDSLLVPVARCFCEANGLDLRDWLP